MKTRRFLPVVIATCLAFATVPTLADGPGAIGNFGPTGIEIDMKRDGTAVVTAVQPGSPAEGLVEKGQIIQRIQGQPMPDNLWDQLTTLGGFITAAEADDGIIRLTTSDDDGSIREIEISIPVLGALSESAPLNCAKTEKIIAANAAYLRGLASDDAGRKRLAGHSHLNALALLSLLSTGQDEDLDVVRAIYAERMKDFDATDTGSHSWNNGYQGIAVTEYFLRTGDQSVMPLINAICESARKYQVNGGWTHWATGVNPQYVGGGLLNCAGNNILITLLLAKQCGADVDEETLQRGIRYAYRFIGHGISAYGDHRPESGYGANNGKTELLAAAMHIASRAKNGKFHAMARDKAAAGTLFGYRSMLGGHTGPIGAMWHAPIATYLAEKEPELFRIRSEQTRWFHELSRRHDGAFVKTACARYNNTEYGRFMLVGLTAPKRTLQITGAAPSPHAVPFELPEAQPWGREADLEFLSLEGGADYQENMPRIDPHLEMQAITKAGKEELAIYAQHPEHVFRESVARRIRDGGHFDLIEELLESPHPQARHTGCLAINHFHPWNVGRSPGWISLQAISPDDFTPRMFEALIAIVRDADGPLWLVDQAMIALALASTEQTMAHINDLLPWIRQNDEWWFQESASIALSPALLDPDGLNRILPEMVKMLAPNPHTKGRGYVKWMLATRTAEQVSPEMKQQIADALKTIYIETPAPPEPANEGDMDLTGIASCHLESTMNWAITVDPTLAAELAELSVERLDSHMRLREINRTATQLVNTAKNLDDSKRKTVAAVLSEHYKPHIIEENRNALSRGADGNPRHFAGPLQMILDIRELAGEDGGWKLFPTGPDGAQTWHFTSYDPDEKPAPSEMNRYRDVTLPGHLDGWHCPDFDPAAHDWQSVTAEVTHKPSAFQQVPNAYRDLMDDAAEVLLLRKEFDLEDIDYELFRLSVHTRQGYRIYLNGEPIAENRGRTRNWNPRETFLDGDARSHLRKGRNVFAIMSFKQYFRGTEGGVDLYLEGLRKFPEID